MKELKKAISENRKCEICTIKTKEAKYIGFWSLCNLFWCNNCLYADKIVEKSSLKTSPGKNSKEEDLDVSKKLKNKLYTSKDKICSCWFAKLIIHFSFISVLNDSGIENVHWISDEINAQKHEYRDLWEEYRSKLEKYEQVWKADKDTRKQHRNQLAKLELQRDENRQLIANEDQLIKQYEGAILQAESWDPLQMELNQLIADQLDLEYEIKKMHGEMKTQALEAENLKLTSNSFNKSISQIDSSRYSKVNRSQDTGYSGDSIRYEYEEKFPNSTIKEASREQEEGSYEDHFLAATHHEEHDNFFRKSDLNCTSASRVTTTKHDTSHLISKNSGTFMMAESFAEKSLYNEEEEAEDSTTIMRSKSAIKMKNRRRNGNSAFCGDSCVIF